MLSTPDVRPQRLLTSRAHRLRKPHRTIRPLTPSVAGRAFYRALHARQSSPPCQAPARRRGFSTTATPIPGRLPLDRSPTSRSKQAHARSLRRSFALAPHPFTHRESVLVVSRGPPRQADPGPAPRAFRPASPTREDASTLRLQPTHDTRTPRIVQPSNHRTARLSPAMTASTPPARSKPWQERDRVEPRLTASLELRQERSIVPGSPGRPARSVL
jgi:hypothetical protein